MEFVPFQPISAPQALNATQANVMSDPYFNPAQNPEATAPFANYFKQALYGLNGSAIGMAGNYINLIAGNKGAPSINSATMAEVDGEIMFKLATAFVSKATSTATMLFQMQF